MRQNKSSANRLRLVSFKFDPTWHLGTHIIFFRMNKAAGGNFSLKINLPIVSESILLQHLTALFINNQLVLKENPSMDGTFVPTRAGYMPIVFCQKMK